MSRRIKFVIGAILLAIIFFVVFKPKQQGVDITDPIPVKYWNKNQNTPLVFYISGDAGFSTFTKNLSEQIFNDGYDVYALNTKSYFWNEKTGQQSADDFSTYLETLFKERTNQDLVIVGYSFGADALPFFYDKIPAVTKNRIKKVILIDPSAHGDLKISLANYISEAGRWETIPKLNQWENANVALVLSGFAQSHYPYHNVKLPHMKIYTLPGNHRFNDDYNTLAKTMISSLSQ